MNTIKLTMHAAAKAFSRAPVQGYTLREALALGLTQRDFTWRGRCRKAVGTVITSVASWFRRRRGTPVSMEQPPAEQDACPPIPASLRGITREQRDTIAQASGTSHVWEAYRALTSDGHQG